MTQEFQMQSDDFLNMGGAKSALVVHPKDNVAVVLADLKAGESCLIRDERGKEYSLTALEDIAFGHKIVLADIGRDGGVVKYGEEIGRMKEPIARGGWVHNHNMYCSRGM